jgi:hypothetical protein
MHTSEDIQQSLKAFAEVRDKLVAGQYQSQFAVAH